MNNIDLQYQRLLSDILYNGVKKSDRTGTGTYSVFGRQIRHDMKEGFPLLTTKKMAWKTMVTELIWFLRGDTNIKWLVENNCNIWNGDAFKSYINKTNEFKGDWPDTMEQFIDRIKSDDEFARVWGELGPVYGHQWRNWNAWKEYNRVTKEERIRKPGIDQITEAIKTLKENPNSRRIMVNSWNVEQLSEMTLPPCHYGFQFYVRDGKYLSLMWNQRSVDTFLGLPFNIASYALLLMIVAKEVDMIPDELIGNLGDVHLYKNHVEQAIEQINREPMPLPIVNIKRKDDLIDTIEIGDVVLIGYESHAPIKAPLSN
jgi:thymidylate synthase